ncbi:hypothetical protein ACFLZ7_03350 [Nanoarchaeota archaeon]
MVLIPSAVDMGKKLRVTLCALGVLAAAGTGTVYELNRRAPEYTQEYTDHIKDRRKVYLNYFAIYEGLKRKSETITVLDQKRDALDNLIREMEDLDNYMDRWRCMFIPNSDNEKEDLKKKIAHFKKAYNEIMEKLSPPKTVTYIPPQ